MFPKRDVGDKSSLTSSFSNKSTNEHENPTSCMFFATSDTESIIHRNTIEFSSILTEMIAYMASGLVVTKT